MQKGQRFTIRNANLRGEPIIEGIATLVKPIGPRDSFGGQRWLVRFDDDRSTYERRVQADDFRPDDSR